MEEIGGELLSQPIMLSHWTLTVLFASLLYLGSESPAGFVSCLAKDPGYRFSSGPSSQILETPKRAFCSYLGSDTRGLNNVFCFTVAWPELSAAASCLAHGQ